jgi:hypothetical protein
MFASLRQLVRRDISGPQRNPRKQRVLLWLENLEDRVTPAVTLTFEGLQNFEPIGEYYNGGSGGFGSGPGPSYGVNFSGNALAITDADSGGSGNFGGEPSSPNIAFFLTGGGALTMNVPGGFERGFSFYYSAINNPGLIRVYDGVNGSGTVIATLTLPTTPFNGAPDPTGAFSPFVPLTVEFTGTARSVDFGGTANQIGFDNITLGPLIEIQDYQQKKTDAVKVATLISEAGVLKADGNPTTKFNKLDNDRFFIVIDDKSIGTPQVVVNQIEVQSLGRDGTTVLDSLPMLRLNRQSDGRFASQPLILVADSQDDAFGGSEGTENDLTIQAEAGGKLKIKYKDPAGTTTEKLIDVGRPSEVKKYVLNVTYLNGPGYTNASVRQMIERASKVFSQANAYLEIKSITGVNDPGGLANLDEYDQPEPFTDANGNGRFTFTDANSNREHDAGEASEAFTDVNGNGQYDGFEMTTEERQLLALNRDNTAKVLNVYFVTSLSQNSIAEAFWPGVNGDVRSGFQTTDDAPLVNSVILSSASHFKTVAHELLHVLFNSGAHEPTDTRRVIYTFQQTETGLLWKRISRTEVATLQASSLGQGKASLADYSETGTTQVRLFVPNNLAQQILDNNSNDPGDLISSMRSITPLWPRDFSSRAVTGEHDSQEPSSDDPRFEFGIDTNSFPDPVGSEDATASIDAKITTRSSLMSEPLVDDLFKALWEGERIVDI